MPTVSQIGTKVRQLPARQGVPCNGSSPKHASKGSSSFAIGKIVQQVFASIDPQPRICNPNVESKEKARSEDIGERGCCVCRCWAAQAQPSLRRSLEPEDSKGSVARCSVDWQTIARLGVVIIILSCESCMEHLKFHHFRLIILKFSSAFSKYYKK